MSLKKYVMASLGDKIDTPKIEEKTEISEDVEVEVNKGRRLSK